MVDEPGRCRRLYITSGPRESQEIAYRLEGATARLQTQRYNLLRASYLNHSGKYSSVHLLLENFYDLYGHTLACTQADSSG